MNDPFWLVVLKTVVVFAFLVVMTLFAIVAERRVVGRMQHRIGPNRVGPGGSLQSLADGVKLMLKEDIIPTLVDKPVYLIAPVASAVPAFMAFSVIPLGPEVSIFGTRTTLQLADPPFGILFAFAMSSLGVYGIVLAGWASGSTYPLLGGLRSSAQMISYEVSMGLSFVAVFLFAGTVTTSGIVAAQHHRPWFALILPVAFLIYATAAVGETNRAPFDLPEAEGELVGGFHTEYSSIKFALFFLAEYINMVTVSALATTMFLGGWRPPILIGRVHVLSTGWFPIVWFLLKVLACIFVFIWLRGTLPRLRYDQFMKFGWKALVPASLIFVVLIACVRLYSNGDMSRGWAVGLIVVLALMLLAVLFWPVQASRQGEQEPDGDQLSTGVARVIDERALPVPSLSDIPTKDLTRA